MTLFLKHWPAAVLASVKIRPIVKTVIKQIHITVMVSDYKRNCNRPFQLYSYYAKFDFKRAVSLRHEGLSGRVSHGMKLVPFHDNINEIFHKDKMDRSEQKKKLQVSNDQYKNMCTSIKNL